MSRSVSVSHQGDSDIARLSRELKREVDREIGNIESLEARMSALETWVVNDLVPWLDDHRTFTGYGTAPPTFTP